MFTLLEQAQLIPHNLSQSLQAMVGFRNIAVHDYQKMNLAIVRHILEHRLTDFKHFKETMLAVEI